MSRWSAPLRRIHFVLEAASKPGHAAAKAEGLKRSIYPHKGLMSFALEIGGRPGPSAVTYMQSLFREEGTSDDYSISDAWTTISVALQTFAAPQILQAHSALGGL